MKDKVFGVWGFMFGTICINTQRVVQMCSEVFELGCCALLERQAQISRNFRENSPPVAVQKKVDKASCHSYAIFPSSLMAHPKEHTLPGPNCPVA